MSLRYPELFLLLLGIAPMLWFAYRRGSNRSSIQFPLSHRQMPWQSQSLRSREIAKLLVRILIFGFILFALARPQSTSSIFKRSAEGIDIMLTLDVSKSMSIEDFGNSNRLDLAKKTLKKFVNGRKDDRIGFVMFSGESVTLCPPTLDYTILQQTIDRANMDTLKDGTAIGDGMANAVGRLKESTAKSKVVILITDGDNNMGSIAPLTAGSLAQGYGIKVYTIALGREGIVNMPVYEDFFGQIRKSYQQVNSTINPELLQKISKETGGKFFRATEREDLGEIFQSIDRLEKNTIQKKEKIQWSEEFQFPLLLGIALLVLEFILTKTYLRVLPN
jgi:Ca-activated chloride channel homolog